MGEFAPGKAVGPARVAYLAQGRGDSGQALFEVDITETFYID